MSRTTTATRHAELRIRAKAFYDSTCERRTDLWPKIAITNKFGVLELNHKADDASLKQWDYATHDHLLAACCCRSLDVKSRTHSELDAVEAMLKDRGF